MRIFCELILNENYSLTMENNRISGYGQSPNLGEKKDFSFQMKNYENTDFKCCCSTSGDIQCPYYLSGLGSPSHLVMHLARNFKLVRNKIYTKDDNSKSRIMTLGRKKDHAAPADYFRITKLNYTYVSLMLFKYFSIVHLLIKSPMLTMGDGYFQE